MGLFIRQDENRSELQERIAAELRRKASENVKLNDMTDGVEESRYVEGMKKTTTLAWAWVAIALVAVGIIIWLTVQSSTS